MKCLNILDLSQDSKLSEEDCRTLDNLSKKVREEYDNYIGQLILNNKISEKGLYLKVSSRNTLVSNLLKNFCDLALLEENIRLNKIPDLIVVETFEMKEIIFQILDKNKILNVEVVSKKNKKNKALTIFLNSLKLIYVFLNSWLLTRLLVSRRTPEGSVVLMDTFLFKETIDKSGGFEDRYYTGHQKYLTKEEEDNIWLAPTLFGLKKPQDYATLFWRSKKLKKNIFLKESWLNLSDYILAIFHSFLASSEVKVIPKFRNLNVSSIVEMELLEERGSLSVFRAICNYRFYRRLSKKNIKINFVINWFENHVNDRALNLSLRKYFEGVYIKGYQGFFLINFYASYEPTSFEYNLKTIPHEINVMNQFSYESLTQLCPELSVKLSPAFRFDHLEKLEDKRSNDKKNIFIPFPGEGMTARGVNLVKNCLSTIADIDIEAQVYVKPHPSFPLERLQKYDPIMLNDQINYTDKSTSEMYEISDLVIATGSVVCAESVALGIPLAISGNSSEITMNPLPDNFKKDLWVVFYNETELKEFINFAFKSFERVPSVESLFHPHTKEGARDLFINQLDDHL